MEQGEEEERDGGERDGGRGMVRRDGGEWDGGRSGVEGWWEEWKRGKGGMEGRITPMPYPVLLVWVSKLSQCNESGDMLLLSLQYLMVPTGRRYGCTFCTAPCPRSVPLSCCFNSQAHIPFFTHIPFSTHVIACPLPHSILILTSGIPLVFAG